MKKLKLNSFYRHNSENKIFKLVMIASYSSGVKEVGGFLYNGKAEQNWSESKRDDFLETFTLMTKKAAIKELELWGVVYEAYA